MRLSRANWWRVLTACAGAVMLLLVPQAFAAEQPTKLVNAAQIESALATTGRSRVIVHVATGLERRTLSKALRDGKLRSATIRSLRARIEPVMLSYFPGGRAKLGRAVKSIDALGAFAADVTAADLERMKKDPRILRIEIDAFRTTNLNASLPLIGQTTVMDAQPNGTDGSGANPRAVAVIDTGVQASHPFIGSQRVVAEACFLSSSLCPNGTYDQIGPGAATPASGESHGTHVAGIVMGRYQSGSPVNRGVASAANLVKINVFGSQGGAYTSDIIQALEHVYSLVITNANPLRIDAINMSLGGGMSSGDCDVASEKDVIDRLRAAGVITAVAAGNGSNRDGMSWPACISSVFSVAATSKTGIISSYSNISRTTDVSAPGGDFDASGCIVSSVMNSQYAAYCGTSMAAPHVAGAVAALRAVKPSASASEIETALKTSGTLVRDTRSGGLHSAPLINVANAISILNGLRSFTLSTQVTGAGTVSSTPGGIACGTSCSASFSEGQSVTLTAVPSTNAMFTGWSGGAASCGASSSCTLTMTQDTQAQASFAPASWIVPLATALDSRLAWTSPMTGDAAAWYGQNRSLRTGDTTGYAMSGPLADGQTSSMETSVTGPGTLSFFWSVSSEANYDFLEFWVNGVRQAGSISGEAGWAQRQFALPQGTHTLRWVYRKDWSVQSGQDAGFVDLVTLTPQASIPKVSLQLVKSGNRAYGSVTSAPSGISCSTSCTTQTVQFNAGQQVTLTATPISGRSFNGWSGACTGRLPSCTVTLSASKRVTAQFR